MINNTALLLLDLQRDFLQTGGRMPISAGKADSVISSANRLVNYAERTSWLTIFVKNEFKKSDWIGNLFRRGAAVEGSPGAEIDPRVVLAAGSPIISKSRADAFTNPALEEILRNANIHQIVILGVMAEGCVRATAKSAISKGFGVTVVADGVASSRDFLKSYGLRSMQRAGATIIYSPEIVQP